MDYSEITIIGAGPAGSTAALFLSNWGIKSTLVDKALFPRDKVCGDCLGGYALSVLKQLGEDVFNKFIEFESQVAGRGVKLTGPDLSTLTVPVTGLVGNRIPEAALSKRIDFDNFLFKEASGRTEIKILDGINIRHAEKRNNELHLFDQHGKEVIVTKLAIIATGSQSSLARELSGYTTVKKNLAGGIRCYYEGITGFDNPGYFEFHFLKELLPGYLWIFPLGKSLSNVGIGIRSDVIAKKKINLAHTLTEMIGRYPHLKNRFSNARLISGPDGFPLSLGSARRKISGDNYMLAGDAASLIEPFFGEGIGNAMYSGKFAAEQAMLCMKEKNYSKSFVRKYDETVYNKIGTSLKISSLMQKAAFYPYLMNRFFKNISGKEGLNQLFAEVINGDVAKNPRKVLWFMTRAITGI